jgi:hypothetical protein
MIEATRASPGRVQTVGLSLWSNAISISIADVSHADGSDEVHAATGPLG